MAMLQVQTADGKQAGSGRCTYSTEDGSKAYAKIECAGVHQIGKKLVEEAAESWMAAEFEGHARAAEEISQLLYHAQVLMLAAGVSLDDVYSHL